MVSRIKYKIWNHTYFWKKKNIGQKQIKIGFGNCFLGIIGKVKALKAKNSILALHQTRKPLHSIRSKMKGNLQNERKYLQTMYLIRVWYPECTVNSYDSIAKLTSKQKNPIMIKNGQIPTWTFFRRCYLRPGTWEATRLLFTLSLGKCKSKLQWDSTS